MGETHFAAVPVALYGLSLLMPALAWYVLQLRIIHVGGHTSALVEALGADWKGKLSPVFYIAGIAFAFVYPPVSGLLYVGVALAWLVPDRRIERYLADHKLAQSE